MATLFLKLVNRSWTAGIMVLAVILLRLLLKKAPRWSFCVLWGLVALRLCLPFSLKSTLSLIPSSEFIQRTDLTGRPFSLETGIDGIDTGVNTYLASHYFEGVTVPAGRFDRLLHGIALVWAAGVCLLFLYAVLSSLDLKRKLRTSTLLSDGIRQSEWVVSPFVFGIFRPVIFLPYQLEEPDRSYVIAHEEAHIRRKDHWWKPLGFLLLSVYWFNPLLWLAYALLCRDIEAACDERVIRDMPKALLKEYSTALLHCSVHRRTIAACPVAFGETGVRERVKNVMNYRKPAFWIILTAVLACVAVSVCLLTDTRRENEGEAGADSEIMTFFPYAVVQVTYLNPSSEEEYAVGENTPQFLFFDGPSLSFRPSSASPWTDLGTMEEIRLTKQTFDNLFATHGTNGWTFHETASWIRENTARAWRLVKNGEKEFFLLLLQKNGDVYLANGIWDDEEQGDPHSNDTRIEKLFLLAPDALHAYPVICGVGADIDGDGIIEDLSLFHGPTSGLSTYTITATAGGDTKYKNTFNVSPHLTGFEVQDDGSVFVIRNSTADGSGERSLLRLTVRDGRFVLDDPEAGYWGGAQWNMNWSENPCGCEVAGIYEVGWTEDPELIDSCVNSSSLFLGPKHLPVFVFENKEQLSDFTDRWSGTLDLRKAFSGGAQRYDDAFFQDHVLMAVYLDCSSSSFRYEVSFIENDHGSITLYATRSNFPEVYDCAMDGWLIVVEIPLDEIAEDTSFDAIQQSGPGGEY